MSAENGFIGCSLNGVLLRFSIAGPTERQRELKSVLEGGPGGAREQLAWREAGYPVRTIKRSWSLASANTRDLTTDLEELLSAPGPHRFCFWKRNVLATFRGDGVRTEFLLPHDQILGDSAVAAALAELPHGTHASFEPVVKIGRAGPELTFDSVENGDYATGPGAGEVFFLNGGAKFKLEAAPAAGVLVYARYTPYFAVLERGQTEKRYADNAREPRALELIEI